jgi:small-conductance mechanosensitive channel
MQRVARAVHSWPVLRWLQLLSALCIVACALPARAEGGAAKAALPVPAAAPAAAESAMPLWPVILDGRIVLEIGFGTPNLSAATRAENISERLAAVAADPSAPALVTLRPVESAVELFAGDHLIADVVDGDGQVEHVRKELVAREWSIDLAKAIVLYRIDHSSAGKLTRLLHGVAALALGLLLLSAIVFLGGRVRRRLHAEIDRRQPGHAASAIVDRERVYALADSTLRFIGVALVLAVVLITLRYVLAQYGPTRLFADSMRSAFWQPVGAFWHNFVTDLPSMVFAMGVGLVTWYLLRINAYIFGRIDSGALAVRGFQQRWAATTESLVALGLIFLGILVAYPYIPGSSSPAFQGLSIFVGVVVSISSNSLISNALAGITLTYLGSFNIGDRVRIGESTGTVVSTGIMTTRLRNRNDEILTVPNSLVIAKDMTTNTSRPHGMVVTSTAGIGYDTPWRQVEAIMKLAASRTPCLRRDPEPYVLALSLNTFDVTYELHVRLEEGAVYDRVLSDLNRNVLDAFNEFGVQIMTPAYVADPSDLKVVPREQWYQAPAALRSADPGSGGKTPVA